MSFYIKPPYLSASNTTGFVPTKKTTEDLKTAADIFSRKAPNLSNNQNVAIDTSKGRLIVTKIIDSHSSPLTRKSYPPEFPNTSSYFSTSSTETLNPKTDSTDSSTPEKLTPSIRN